MSKLFNNKFLFIMASSLIVLIVLVIGAFYLFDDSDDMFIRSGYVLNPLSSTSEKYFFDENVKYKENLSSMIEFTDIDSNKVEILKDSFLHYNDESLSFLQNGAILLLDSINGNDPVVFYNITKDSIIEKTDKNYTIKSAKGDINLTNFIGRINDNKYIIVGDLNLKMNGNATMIAGHYFEIVYLEEGVVSIENKDVKYQVMAEGTSIHIGNDMTIELGDKKIVSKGKDVMSITAITIDGNENVEIIPVVEDKSSSSSSSSIMPDAPSSSSSGNGEGTGGEGEGGSGKPGTDIKTTDIIVSLKKAVIGSTNVDVTFDIDNATDKDSFSLQVINLSTGRTVDVVASVVADTEIKVNLLSPNTKYLFVVINNRDENKYFQKIFETSGFGIKLEKTYATDSAISYLVTIEEGTDITNAKLSLYKYNEETKQNEIVKTSYYDAATDETKYVEKVTNISSLGDNIEGKYEIVYDNLDSNTIYTAVLDEFSVASSNFKDIYNIALTSMTLKKTPSFSDMTIDKNVGTGEFKLALGNITDKDNAIVNYTYLIYESNNDEDVAITPISKSNASPITIGIGAGTNKLKNDTNYYYKVIIEYFDNEKYIEYETSDSIAFLMGTEPYVTIVPNSEQISYNQIGATIYIKDNSCMLSMPEREKCSGTSTTVIDVSKINPVTGERTSVFTRIADFEIMEDGMLKYDLLVENLQAGTTYNVEVRGTYNTSNDNEKIELLHTEESKRNISTLSLASFMADWVDQGSSANHAINIKSKFIADEDTGTLSGEESAATIKRVVAKLYEGNYVSNLQSQAPIAVKSFENTEDFNIKESFYDSGYIVTSDETFGLDIDGLKALNSDGKLSEFYTLALYAYYDYEGKNEVILSNNITAYKISPILLMENIEDPVITISPITNRASGKVFSNLINDGTTVGYLVTAAYDRSGLILNNIIPNKINYYVYNSAKEKVNFYLKNSSNELVTVNKYSVDLTDSNYVEARIYMDYGTDYLTVDEMMTRGNGYYIGYEIEVSSAGSNFLYPSAKNDTYPSDYGIYSTVVSEKETPNVKMYIASSTENSITYRYNIDDPDCAIYRESLTAPYGFYYTIGELAEAKLNLTKTDAEYNAFAGNLTLSGLSNGDLYTLYYKKNVSKSGDLEADIAKYLDGDDSGVRLFDGYYDAKQSKYNFKYQVINNPLVDNKVIVKILATDDFIDRIISYRLHFTDTKNNKLNKELWKLVSCEDEKDTNRCFTIDYTELKNAGMKSNKNENNTISLSVEAIYDNGLAGYDFAIGTEEDDDYNYCIMQNNSTGDGFGKYISFSVSGTQLTNWEESLEVSKGYYDYSLTGNLMYYQSKLNETNRANITVSLMGIGYTTRYGVATPKMISVDSMTSETKTFSFNSITPKANIRERSTLLDGAVIDINLSGIDLADIKNEGTTENPKYYIYVDTWASIDDIGTSNYARPQIKVALNSTNPTSVVTATINGLNENQIYYFNVYAYMYKNNQLVYTQLFDAGYTDRYEEKTYNFKTLKTSDIFHSIDVGYTASEEVYGNRNLNTKINLLAYKNMYPYDFDMIYILCEIGDVTCGIGSDKTNIFKKSIPASAITTEISDVVDISSYDLEYDKNYYMYIYAVVDNYNGSSDPDDLTKYNILLNKYNFSVKLRKLVEPTFVITRNASIVNGDYVIDFNVVVNDPDRTLVNGNYFIKLTNASDAVIGTMQLLDENGDYVDVADYTSYAFDAFTINKSLRIKGLSADQKYIVTVYNDAYLNNYSETVPKVDRTYRVKKSHTVYTSNSYGVAFGRDLLYSATETSMVVTFLGGSNFNGVSEVSYTIGLWDDEFNTSTASGTFVIGEGNKQFELYKNSEDWRFVIDPEGLSNTLGQTYTVALSFKVLIPGTSSYAVLTSADNPAFSGRTQYVEDE